MTSDAPENVGSWVAGRLTGRCCVRCLHRHERTDTYGNSRTIKWVIRCPECGCTASESEYMGRPFDHDKRSTATAHHDHHDGCTIDIGTIDDPIPANRDTGTIYVIVSQDGTGPVHDGRDMGLHHPTRERWGLQHQHGEWLLRRSAVPPEHVEQRRDGSGLPAVRQRPSGPSAPSDTGRSGGVAAVAGGLVALARRWVYPGRVTADPPLTECDPPYHRLDCSGCGK